MWLAGAGIVLQEALVGFDVDTSNLEHFRIASTLPIAIVTSFLIGVVTLLLVLLLGKAAGFWAGFLLAVDPYIVGMSQVVHLDVLLALFMLCAVLFFWLYERDRKTLFLVLVGLFSGLALATKLLPALWLFVFFAVVLLWKYRLRFSWTISRLSFIVGFAVVVLWLVWPVLWFTDDVGRSFERDIKTVVTQEHVAIETSLDPIEPSSFYVRTLVGRTTPFVLIVVLGVLIVSVRSWVTTKRMPFYLWLLMYLVGFLILITFVAKKADRYLLPALVILPVIAGMGLSVAFKVLLNMVRDRVSTTLQGVFVLLLLVLFSLQTLLWSPHAIAYNNPIFPNVRPLSQQGWGEGLEEVAEWLNMHPLGEELTIASWYPGVVRTYFQGRTMSLSSRNDDRVGYVVTYRNMRGRGLDDVATNVLEEFEDRQPVHTASIMGVEYVWVYDVIGIPYFDTHVGELIGGMEVGQIINVGVDNWNGIDIGMSNFSGRNNTGDVTLHIRDNVNSSENLRTVTINASDVIDSDWNTFLFDAIPDSDGKTFYVALTSENSVPGNAITIRFSETDIRPGQMLLRRRALRDGETNDQFLREGDIAYRIR